ncbi:MAG: hypothetical protein ABSC31_05610 [Acidimicrobiales bacterium]|jgi:hypothetical protein
MITTEARLIRLENAVNDLSLMVTDGNPGREVQNVSPIAAKAAKRFLEIMDEIHAERSA